MKRLTRRQFLKRASLSAAAGFAMIHAPEASAQMRGGMGGGMGGGGGTGIIDPPAGAAFADPAEMANLSIQPGVVAVEMDARAAWVNVGGTMANLLTYNGTYPGPTIRVRKGDLLKVRFRNSLLPAGTNLLGHERELTNLHTHGLHVSPSGNSDNSMLAFRSGEIFDYEFDCASQYPGTLNFYHPHSHGTVAEQYWGGMAGALVVEDDIDVLSSYETHLMVFKDLTLAGSEPEAYTSVMQYMHGKEGNTVMVNGQVNPVLAVKPGQVQRWRVLNACNARFLKLSLEGHTLHIVGTEGGLIDKPYAVSSILLSPGERLDILVRANQATKNYRFLSLPYSRQGNMAGQQVTLLTMSYQGARVNDFLPATINPAARRSTAMPAKTERMVLTMGQGKGYINGISFSEAGAFTLMSTLGTYEVWDIVNQSGMDHPFHQHVNACQVLSITGGDAGYTAFLTRTPAWKDVVIVPKWGSVRLLVPVMDHPGMAMFHCHIIEHEDIGMMGMWHIMEEGMPM